MLGGLYLTVSAAAQPTRFDLINFTPPKGWKKTAGKDAWQFAIQSADEKSFCLISIYKSVPAGEDALANFNNSWAALVNESLGINVQPEMQEPASENGWTAQTGYASFSGNEISGVALLVSSTGYNRVCNILMITNTQDYQEAADAFFSSISFSKPPAGTKQPAGTPPRNTTSQPAPPKPPAPVSANPAGILKSTTTFTDGWTATAREDFVEVSKNDTRVLLHYGIPITDEIRSSSEVPFTQYYWNQLAAGRYSQVNLTIRQPQTFDYPRIYYAEAVATEKASGKKVFVAFRIIPESGIAFVTECISPSQAVYNSQFPNLDALAAMRNSNRFAVSAGDLQGEWTSSSTSAMQLYNVYTGLSAGMQYAAGADDFNFKPGGTYNSRHRGGYGNVSGNQTFYDDKYNGKFSFSDWELTLTNRFKGKTEVFSAHYEAVRGGRILHLVNKQFSGLKYALYKLK